jgi:hypothetical protein
MRKLENGHDVSPSQPGADDLLADLRSRMIAVRAAEAVVAREGVGSTTQESDLRSAWAECDALAERIAALRPATLAVVKAKAAAYLWLEGWCGPQGEEARARIVAEVMAFLAGVAPESAPDA